MKILVLCSGGDAPGMNKFVWNLYKKFKKETFYAYSGFSGLIKGQIFPLRNIVERKSKNCAGTVIKSSRCPEFKEEKFFKLGLANAKKFDVVVILGGNGSEKGAKALFENGVNTIFVPATIDNDVEENSYSIGFDTAVKEGIYAIKNTMPSIYSMNSSCLFEVMGRKHDAICQEVAKAVQADYVICNKESLDYEKIKDVILKKLVRSDSACVVVRENIVEVEKIAEKLNLMLGADIVKTQVVGRTQRGGEPTARELKLAKCFAKETVRLIKTKVFGVRILMNDKDETIVKEFI